MTRLYVSDKLYRSRDGMILGVCKGIARNQNTSAFLIRLLAILTLCIFGPVAIFLYIVTALVVKQQPQLYTAYEFDYNYRPQYQGKNYQLDYLNKRVSDLEHVAVSRKHMLEKKFKELEDNNESI